MAAAESAALLNLALSVAGRRAQTLPTRIPPTLRFPLTLAHLSMISGITGTGRPLLQIQDHAFRSPGHAFRSRVAAVRARRPQQAALI
jgi:hypothetical protein